MSRARALSLVALACLGAATAGCASSFVRLPPAAASPRGAGRSGGVRLNQVEVASGARERPADLARARDQLAELMRASFRDGPPGEPPVWVDLRVDASLSSCCYRGYQEAAVALANPLIAPFTMAWPLWPDVGAARLDATMVATYLDPASQATRSYELRLEVRAPYSIYWYSFFRTAPRDRAFRRAWQLLLEQVPARLARWIRVLAPQTAPPSEPAPRADGLVVTERDERLERAAPGQSAERSTLVVEDPDEWRVITTRTLALRRKPPPPRGLLARYFAALGGVDVGYLLGRAWVRSEASDSHGDRYTIASGDASTRGYRIDLYTIPEKSTFFVHPTVGFLSLDIDIHDFRQQIPMLTVPGAKEIPGVGSNPATGEPVDLTDPNVYSLFLRSFYIGQRLSATLVIGTSRVQLFATVEGGFNIIEFRHARVRLGAWETSGWSFPWFFSGQAKGIVGLAIRPWHVAFRVEGHYEAYRQYSFPQPLEFKGRVEYNPKDQTQERRVIMVEAAGVGVANVFFSVNFFY
jgi:hypothetical protein